MLDVASIRIRSGGPYLVPTELPVVVKRAVTTALGEPIAWVTGPRLAVPGFKPGPVARCRCGASRNKPYCDGSHRGAGFDPEDRATGTYDQRAKPMEGPGLVVRDDRSICGHAGFCGTAATNVWKMVAEATRTDVRSQMVAMIERCPSGALTYSIEGADGDVEPDLAPEVAVVPDGPLYVTGGVPVVLADGTALEVRQRVTLCRCGASANKPLCDGSHRQAGFRHTP